MDSTITDNAVGSAKPNGSGPDSDARLLVTKVFRYLDALNQLRNPVTRHIKSHHWSKWFQDLPAHLCVTRGDRGFYSPTPEGSEGTTAAAFDDFVLRVKRPELTEPPVLPASLAEWVLPGWENPDNPLKAREFVLRPPPQGESLPTKVMFDSSASRVKAWEEWGDLRETWAETERLSRKTLELFDDLFEIRSKIEREGEKLEFVLGDGILDLALPIDNIHHPILLQRVQLEFDAKIPEFRIVETDHPSELYTALFRILPDVDARAIGALSTELLQKDYSPLGGEETTGFLKKVTISLSPRGSGQYVGNVIPGGEARYLRMGRSPVLFLRERNLGFASAIESILKDLGAGGEIPQSLLNIVGAAPPNGVDPPGTFDPVTGEIDDQEDILFGKPSNKEQAQIVRQMERNRCVLVQGPPGTGKTHTIGNLIGHALAKGQSVLVTAHTSKALRVLRNHVEECVRPLCVSVLDSDTASQEQLKGSVEEIVRQITSSDSYSLKMDAAKIDQERKKVLQEAREARVDLAKAIGDEYRPIVFAGQSVNPSDAGKRVKAGVGKDDWIPGDVWLGGPLPLSVSENEDLYRTNIRLTPKDESELSFTLPNPSNIPSPESFAEYVKNRHLLSRKELSLRDDLWNRPLGEEKPKEFEALAMQLASAVDPIPGAKPWEMEVYLSGFQGDVHRGPWENLVAKIEAVAHEAANTKLTLQNHGPVLAKGMPPQEQARLATEIADHLRDGGKLGAITRLFHSDWARFAESAKVSSNKPPSTQEHFRALATLATLTTHMEELCEVWDRTMGVLGAPASSGIEGSKDRLFLQYTEQVLSRLNWYRDVLSPLIENLKAYGFAWETFLNEQPPDPSHYGMIRRLRVAISGPLQGILMSRADAVRWKRYQVVGKKLKDGIAPFIKGANAADVVKSLLNVVISLNPEKYTESHGQLVELHQRRPVLEARTKYLKKIEEVAPSWAAAVKQRFDRHGIGQPPGDAVAAWEWKQLSGEIDRRAGVSLQELQRKVESCNSRLRKLTNQMIERLAWAHEIDHVGHEQRMALVGWQHTVKRIGAGTGKMVDSHRMEAKKLMAKCKGSVPVWVMPLTRVVENFDPADAKFDLVIIDEASQSDLMTLIVLYMAKKVIVVGDDEQVSPLGVGQNLDEVNRLIKSNLEGVPNHHLYDGQLSIYNIGQQAFGGTVCLVEHFRSVPEIIHFSNHLSYNGRILPLRESSGVNLKPHVLDYRVEADFVTRKKVNLKEADHVAALMIACTNMPEYKEKTFGVVSMVGEEQAVHIERLLRRHMPLAEFLGRRVSCGNSANFQGDERDVMFLSMVDCKGEEQGPLSKREQKLFKQRYNVAASRARDQMWVVHSLDPDTDLKQDDLRRRLIKYAQDPSDVIRALQQVTKDSESPFEEEVAQRLVRAGYRISQQKWVGHYRIDIVIENHKRKIAIECDGDKHHPPEKIAEDMARQAILERLGWKFIRIRGSRFYRDSDGVIKEVFQELEYLGATPDYSLDAGGDSPKDDKTYELRNRIILRAHEILRGWEEERERIRRSEEETGAEQEGTRRFARRKKGEGPRSGDDTLKLF